MQFENSSRPEPTGKTADSLYQLGLSLKNQYLVFNNHLLVKECIHQYWKSKTDIASSTYPPIEIFYKTNSFDIQLPVIKIWQRNLQHGFHLLIL